MDTSKEGVSFVENFPLDIWVYMVIYLTGEHLLRLKLTGSKRLWSKLRATHVVKSVELGNDYLQFKSWPAFLNDLPSIEILSIDSPNRKWWSGLCMKLHSVPRTVSNLKIDGRIRNFGDFFCDSDGGVLKFVDHAPQITTLIFSANRILESSWLTHFPPTLTKLYATLPDGVELPASLICFKTNRFNARTYTGKIPPHLESFVADFLVDLPLLVPSLPPSMLRIYAHEVEYFASETLFEQLPRSLTRLHLPTVFSDLPNAELLVAQLPPTLTEFETHPEMPWWDFPASIFAILPSTLTTLKCFGLDELSTVVTNTFLDPTTGKTHEFRSYPFETLPRSLTHLELHQAILRLTYCAAPSHASNLSSYFPPHLTYLSLFNAHLAPETVKLLPTSLTYLEMGMLCELVSEHLPRGLIYLEAQNASDSSLMSPNMIKFLPKSLTSLELNSYPSDCRFDYHTGKAIYESDQCLIHQMMADGKNIDWKKISLPPNLTHLAWNHCPDLTDSVVLDNHLTNLVELRLPQSNLLSDQSIPFLCRHLTELTLDGSQVTGNSFENLPRNLIRLRLRNSKSIFDTQIQHLPKTLKTLWLEHAVHLTDLCVPDLPRQLQWLDLQRNENITPSSLPYMPYDLRFSCYAEGYLILATWIVNRGRVNISQKLQ